MYLCEPLPRAPANSESIYSLWIQHGSCVCLGLSQVPYNITDAESSWSDSREFYVKVPPGDRDHPATCIFLSFTMATALPSLSVLDATISDDQTGITWHDPLYPYPLNRFSVSLARQPDQALIYARSCDLGGHG